MKKSILIAFFMFTLWSNIALEAAAREPYQGNYATSCHDCKITPANPNFPRGIACSCEMRPTPRLWSQYNLAANQYCFVVKNVNGTLQPDCSYVQSCKDCSWDGTTLTCQCKDGAGNYKQSSYKPAENNNCFRIKNDGGVLKAEC